MEKSSRAFNKDSGTSFANAEIVLSNKMRIIFFTSWSCSESGRVPKIWDAADPVHSITYPSR